MAGLKIYLHGQEQGEEQFMALIKPTAGVPPDLRS